MSPRGPGALIVDAGERSAVAACRCLAAAGYRVGAASSARPAPAEWSRHSERRFALPDPRLDPAAFAAEVGEVAKANRYGVVLPCSEGSLWALARHREAAGLDAAGIPAASLAARCTSKEVLLDLAGRAGLGAPETVVCSTLGQAREAAAGFGYPVVVKPHHTVIVIGGDTLHLAATVVGDPAALEARLATTGWPCLVQRRESGPLVSFAGVLAGGELLGFAASRYLRTWPADAGPVCCSRTFAPPDALVRSVTELISSLGWEGIFELELVERGSDHAVLDLNPRLYGSLALAVAAGAPLPLIWSEWLLHGRRIRAQARPAVWYRWSDADLRYAAMCLRRRRLATMARVLRPHRHVAHPYLSLRDPVPMLVRALAIARGTRAAEPTSSPA